MDFSGFSFGNITVDGALVAAPMDGITDSAFRRLLRRHGASLCYSEFINAQDVIHDSILYERKANLVRAEERPIGFQIYDNDPAAIEAAAKKLLRFQPDFIDINIGCSVARVAGRGAGAGLLLEPTKITEIFDRLSDTLPVPLTAKIRLGWDERSYNYLSISKLIEEHGGALIAVHGRTRKQGFQGSANWDAIRAIKEEVHIPVIGNGDVITVEDIHRMREVTRCDGVMIGRAAIANPWLFELRGREEISNQEVFALIQEHLALMLEDYEEGVALTLFRKFLNQYLLPFHLDRGAKIVLFDQVNVAALLDAVNNLLQL
ncbi:MAG TPA: tRNA dihydrouridine synthase DusB [Anaerolineaceae bacterium]|nr:tRNA dihydrouridine synthase DusB [Anaerolineaceae bacterium]